MSIQRLHRQTQLLPASRHNLYSAAADLSFYFVFVSRLLTDLRSTLKARQLCRVAPGSPEILEAWCQGWAVTLSAALTSPLSTILGAQVFTFTLGGQAALIAQEQWMTE